MVTRREETLFLENVSAWPPQELKKKINPENNIYKENADSSEHTARNMWLRGKMKKEQVEIIHKSRLPKIMYYKPTGKRNRVQERDWKTNSCIRIHRTGFITLKIQLRSSRSKGNADPHHRMHYLKAVRDKTNIPVLLLHEMWKKIITEQNL
jgi:hypothetical protein